MDIYDFAVNYPELYQKIDNEVASYITTYQMSGTETLQDLDNFVDSIYKKYEPQDSYDYDYEDNMIVGQQFDYRNRGRCRNCDRDHHRRHRRDFDLRDLTRIIFLRRLFDRNRF